MSDRRGPVPKATSVRDVTLIALGRFHHFHLARQLEQRGRLKAVWTGYPRYKLRDEHGVPAERIHTFTWFYVPAQLLGRVPVLGRSQALAREMQWRAVEAIDLRVALTIDTATTLVGLSSGGLRSGRRAQAAGGRYVCDRGSTHIRFQDAILKEEYRRWKLEFYGVDRRVMAKEEAEYEAADQITVPSGFCRESFLAQGVPASKMNVIPYGGRLDRFRRVAEPEPDAFTIVFVGAVSVRKGVPYLLQAFARLRHPRKRLKIIGHILPDFEGLLRQLPTDGVEFLGGVANTELSTHYSTADVMVLPSLEEGLALVMAEAMACGCPVIASENTGAGDLFTDRVEGRILPVRSTDALVEALEALIQDRPSARELGRSAQQRIRSLGGYDRFGDDWAALLARMETAPSRHDRSTQGSGPKATPDAPHTGGPR